MMKFIKKYIADKEQQIRLEMKTNWSKRFSFEQGIGLVMFVAFILVIMTGVIAFNRFTGVVNKLSEETIAETQLLKAEVLFNELTDADNNVKSFSLSKDSIYLDQFYNNVTQITKKINDLEKIEKETEDFQVRMERLDFLVEEKLLILQDVLYLQDPFRVGQALKKVDDELNSLNTKSEIENKNLIQKMFRSTRRDAKESVDKLQKKIKTVRSEELKIELEIKEQELALFNRDKQVTTKIRNMLDMIQEGSLQRAARRAEVAARNVKETNQQIAIFCIFSGILLLVMGFIIANYVSNNKRYKKALRQAKREAEELGNAKSRFLANMSHEIRTPLNAIIGFTDQLAETPLAESQSEDLQMIQKSADHLLYLINDVLDLTKLQAHKLSLEKLNFCAHETMDEVMSIVATQAKDKNLKLLYDWHPQIPKTLAGDPHRLKQIMLNLLNNAIKFTSAGEVKMNCSVKLQNDVRTTFCMEVSDTGIGMNEEQIQKIFEEFEQAELSTTRQYGGSGLGLSIVKMLVELHKGIINVASTSGKGTSIKIEIPYLIGTDEQKIIEKKELSTDGFRGKRILIVDDEEFNRKLLNRILAKYAFVVSEAENGQQAIKEAEANEYDMILMDMRMPVMNGMDATRSIRRSENKILKKIPIIALTAATTQEEKEQIEALGINGFMAKPFKERALIEKMQKIFKTSSKKLIKTSMRDSKSKKAEKPVLNFDYLRSTSPRDDDFYCEMLQLFNKSLIEGMVEIKQEGIRKDWEAVANLAHKMSTPCKHLGADELYSLLKSIEKKGRTAGLEGSWEQDLSRLIELSHSAVSLVNEELTLKK
jgi:signal transduction histidine kinase/DNA-binding NarL/FixJ family response regulator